jgi:hypothetical protein
MWLKHGRHKKREVECAYCHRKFMGHATSRACSRSCTQRLRHGPDEARFWANVKKTDTCWVWTGTGGKRGKHGTLQWNNKRVGAHRISYELHNGPIPDGLWVLHRCDNRPCVNPDHLFLGTHQDNMADKVQKGRHKGWWPGESHPACKLTAERVRAIRRDVRPGHVIATEHGVSASAVYCVKNRKSWAHVPD